MALGHAVGGVCVDEIQHAIDAYYSAVPVVAVSDGAGGFQQLRYDPDSESASGWSRVIVTYDSAAVQTGAAVVAAPSPSFQGCNLSLASDLAQMTATDAALISTAIVSVWLIGWVVNVASRVGSQHHD